ncbi:MAG: glycosyltransferase family 4 protein [Candidatus Shapirobacteria bacterium]
MKILMVTPYLPYPPSSGGQVRSFNLIKHLAKNHQITLFSLIKSEKEKEYVNKLSAYCSQVRVFKRSTQAFTLGNILRTGFGFYPFLVIRNFSAGARLALEKELKENKYDLIHAETFYVMPHLPETQVPILLVDQTIEFQVYQHYMKESKNFFLKPFLYLDVLKIKYWEKKFWQKANKVIAVSKSDKKKMQSLVKNLDVGIVPNGAGEDLTTLWGKRKPAQNPIILFQANYSWLQNVEAAKILAKEVFPKINQKIPQSICWIVGQEAQDRIGYLASPKIKIIDLAREDIKGVIKAYKEASIFISPLRGPGGTRLKILAAMAAGVPVITTRVGIEGIDAQNKKQVLIEDNWEKMAQSAISLLENKKLYQIIIKSAHKLVEKKYSYSSIAHSLDKIYRQAAKSK